MQLRPTLSLPAAGFPITRHHPADSGVDLHRARWSGFAPRQSLRRASVSPPKYLDERVRTPKNPEYSTPQWSIEEI
jgi:hypothetical protein